MGSIFLLGTEWSLRYFDREGQQLWEVPVPGDSDIFGRGDGTGEEEGREAGGRESGKRVPEISKHHGTP